MNLSQIDTSVYYPITIPSTKFATKYRPFRVREERALLTAQQTGETGTMLSTLEHIVRSCIVNCPTTLTTFDIEYAFIHIRSKSVDESADLVAKCTECGEKNDIRIDLTTAKVVGLQESMNLQLSPTLHVTMKYPTLGDVANVFDATVDKEELTVAASIQTVYFEDSVWHTKDSETTEIVEFLLNRSDAEMQVLTNFIENTPTVVLESEFNCKKCSHTNKVKIEGMADFF